MVQLNTTYDSSIHQKIFVLKGDEAYARTTDTIATLITDFDNYATYIEKCHVGLEIQVLRELGVSKIYIYIDDEVPWEIPWSDSGMAQIIDEDWNEQGVYWENGKLIIGKYDHDNDINTGLFLLYDVEHTIKVKYEGNKNCLGSSAKPIVFTVPKPDYFATTLTFNKENPRYAPDTTINDITVTLTSDHELTTAKTVNIYDVTSSTPVLLTTVDLEQDVASTITLTGLSDGLHKIRASWVGDSESYATDSEIELSVGYKLNATYPSYLFTGQTGKVSCFVADYFNNSWENLPVKVSKWVNNAWTDISSSSTTDSNGFVELSNVAITSDPYALKVDDWYDEKHTTPIIEVSGIQVSFQNPITDIYVSGTATNKLYATVIGQNSQPLQIADIPLTVKLESYLPTETWNSFTNEQGKYSERVYSQNPRVITATVTVKDTQISNSAKWIVPEYWWSSSDYVQEGSYTADSGINVTKVSNGFKFDYHGSPAKNVYFGYGLSSGVYVIEYDCTYASFYESPSEVYVCGMAFPIGRGGHYKFVHDIDNGTVQSYIGKYPASSWSFNEKRFQFGVMNYNVILDNLVIVREE